MAARELRWIRSRVQALPGMDLPRDTADAIVDRNDQSSGHKRGQLPVDNALGVSRQQIAILFKRPKRRIVFEFIAGRITPCGYFDSHADPALTPIKPTEGEKS